MASLLACAEAGFEPIPGYVLRQKLGAGGYGEVWLADAPGGLKKAIKFVFGSLDDDRASRELKALNRIRQVNHPFLLSLERIEVIEGQLLIVTELADGCLHDRCKRFVEQGAVGIPRDQLLDYLRDAADALDFLCQKHDLQHLDVKPANMLLVADRVKVADFGLVKDVQSNSMSMMGGMTPIYAAPEMFDGRPGRFSDQYSLAIVYQELLTGTLPFGGRTTAQLASEHLHRAPNLDPVPPADRPLLVKALAKKPNQRFSSCREFVEQLLAVGRAPVVMAAPVASPSPANHYVDAKPRPRPAIAADDKSISTSSSFVPPAGNTSPSVQREVVTLPEIEFATEAGYRHTPAMFLGIGGTGAEMLTSLRAEMAKQSIVIDDHDELSWLLVDTDDAPLQTAVAPETCGCLDFNSVMHLPLKSPQYYRDLDEHIFSPISRRWLYNVPRSKATEGIRPLAMLALLDHAELCYKVITNYVAHLAQQSTLQQPEQPPTIRVYLMASAHGATGGGTVNEFAFLVRRAMDEQGVAGQILAFLTASAQDDRYGHSLQGASAMVCLSEMEHYFQTAGLHPGLPTLPMSQAAPRAPIDNVYLVQGGVVGDRDAWETAIDQAVEYIYADACSPLGKALDAVRSQTHSLSQDGEVEWTPWLRTLGSRRLDIDSRLSPEYLTQLATLEVSQQWMKRLKMNLPESAADKQGTSPRVPHSRKVLEQMDFLVSDLFRNQRWTAQAFVARCVVMLDQEQYVPLEDPTTDFEQHTAMIDPKIEVEVDLISGRLGLELERSRYDANCLLDATTKELTEWLQVQCSESIEDAGYWGTLMQLVSKRFVEQGSGLRNVSLRLRTEHDAILDKIHSQSGNPLVDPNVTAELDRLEIQARLHEIAGLMLIRLGDFVHHQATIWQAKVMQLYKKLHDLCIPIAQQLDLRLDGNGMTSEPAMPLPMDWVQVQEKVMAFEDASLKQWTARAFAEVWGKAPSDEQVITSDSIPMVVPASTTSAFEPSNDTTSNAVAIESSKSLLHAMVDAACDLAIAECTEASLKWNAQPKKADQPLSSSLVNQMRDSTPSLLQWGGAKRNILILPGTMRTEEAIQRWRSMFQEAVSILFVPQLANPILLCEGEQLCLNDVRENLWIPTGEKTKLAQRVQSRVDVDWIPH